MRWILGGLRCNWTVICGVVRSEQPSSSDDLKILIAGDWHSNLHEEVVDRAFRQLGHETVRFPWHQYFEPTGPIEELLRPAYRAQNKYLVGPLVARINGDLIASVEESAPDVVFIYRGSHIYRETLRRIKQILTSVILL